jgi:CubicO group peptidase (beta-lactamase class C family)
MNTTPSTPRIVLERSARSQSPGALILAATLAAALLNGCTAVRTVMHNFADLDDHRIFANRRVEAPAEPSRLRDLARTPRFMSQVVVPGERGSRQPLDRYLEETDTAAFVVLHEDRVVYERYSRGYKPESMLNSFSIAKSMLATLVGIAVGEGRIASLDATVAHYRPELAATAYGNVTLKHLLTMTSGVEDRPSILPGRAQYYYGDDLREVIAGARPPRAGAAWRYSEADAQVLGFTLEAAVGKTLSAYLAEKLWQPLGMESDALWALDREGGVEKSFCCISARARDFARFGRLYLDGGRWNGVQVVPAAWAALAMLPGVRTADGYTHRHLWWIPPDSQGDYYAYGHNGQYLYVNPAARTVIVKFSETNGQDPVPMFRAISEALKAPERIAEIDRLAAQAIANR